MMPPGTVSYLLVPFVACWFGLLRGGVKKTVFFTVSKNLDPPSPFLTTSVFSDKDFLDQKVGPDRLCQIRPIS